MADDKILRIRLIGDSKSARSAVGKTEKAYAGLGKKMLKIGAALGGISLGANVIGDIVRVGKQYNSTMNSLQAASQATDKQMAAVKETARALGADLTLPATSAADATGAMLELYKGGLSLSDSMDAAKGSIQLAAAAQISGAEAAKIQANALSQFSLEGADASKVADVLANVANSATGELTDVGTALSYVGPVAQSVSMDIDQTGTAIGLLSKNAIIGQKAGTGLRAIIAGLANPSAKAAGALEELGVQAFDAKGNFVGMRDITEQLSKAKKNLTEQEFAAAAAAAFGREPLAAINALAKEGTKGWDGMAKAVGREGAAADLAAAKNKGFGGAVDGLQSQLEDFYLIVWDKVEPALTTVAEKAGEGLEALNSLLNGEGMSAGGLAAMLNDFDGAEFGQKLADAIGTAFDKIGSLAGKLGGAIRDLFADVDWVGLGVELGKAAIPMLAGLVIGIMNVDLGALLSGLASHWQEILIGVLSIAFAPAKIAGALAKILGKIPFVGKFLAWIVKALQKVGKKLKKFAKSVWDKFAKGFKDAIGWSGPGVVARIVGFFGKIRKKIAEWGGRLAKFLGDKARDMAEKLGRTLARLGPAQAFRALVKIKNKVTGFFRGAGSWLWNAGKKLIGGLVDGIKSMLGSVGGAVGSVASKVRGFFPFSPVKEGPLTKWNDGSPGKNLVKMLAGGLRRTKPVEDAVNDLAARASEFKPRFSAGASYSSGGSALRAYESGAGARGLRPLVRGSQGGTTIIVPITVEGNVIGEKDFAKRVVPTVRDELAKIGKRNGGRIFGGGI